MSERKFTPGPWEWVGFYLESNSPGHYEYVIEPTVDCGQFCYGGTVNLKISDADSRLIAAAPELLDALQAMVLDAVVLSADYLETFRDWPNDKTIQGWDKARWMRALAAYQKANAAIAKATGSGS